MGDAKKRLLAWIAKLLPTQSNSGEAAVQIGKAGGNVTIVNLTTHNHSRPSQDTSTYRKTASRSKAATQEQHLVLQLLDRVPDRKAVLDFMRREFGTTMVIDLDERQLFRLRRYVEVILSKVEETKHAPK